MTQKIRDRNGKLIGIIETKSNGDQVAMTTNRVELGYYSASENKTRDRNNRLIANGNIVASLIVE